MKLQKNQLLKSLSVASLLVVANGAVAETVTVDASVTVNNAINFTSTGELNFGQVRATAAADADECAGLTLSPTGTTLSAPDLTTGSPVEDACGATAVGALQSVGGTISRPVFTIAGVAPFTRLNVELPTTAVDLAAATGPGTPQFQVVGFLGRKTSGTAGPLIDNDEITTDADGGATFTVGASLITHPGALTGTLVYQDMTYTGQFDVSVSY